MRWMTAKRTSLLVLCAILVLAGACKKDAAGPGTGEDGAGGVGEEGLGAGSLEKARRGLGPEEDGILKDVHFGYDSDDVEPSEHDRLAQNVAWLRDNPRAKVELEGHCDSRGTIEYNLGLGARRASSVKDHLIGQGIAADRMSTISYGKELPLCQDESEACWTRNRRVHFVVLR